MSKALAICIEDLDVQAKIKYLRCVALPGRQPGLRLDEVGSVLWQSDDGVSCELCVSADDRLMLYRPEGAVHVTLRRAGRSLDAPCGKPVVVIDQDQIDVGSRRLRVHVHGKAPSVVAPSPLPARPRPLGRLARTVATAAVIGTVAATGGCTDAGILATPTIQVIEDPPVVAIEPDVTVADAIRGDWTASQAYDVGGERGWITGTLTIKGSVYTFIATREITGTSVQGELDFLFDNPSGEAIVEYHSGVSDIDDAESFAPGDTLATFVFRADSTDLGEFLIKVHEHEGLYLYSPSGEDGLWRITKPVGSDSGK